MEEKRIMFGYNNIEGMPHDYHRAEVSQSYKEKILKPLGLSKGSKVLDMACGGGHEAEEIREISGATVIESDLNLQAYLSSPKPERNFVVTDIGRLPFADNFFDLVHIKDGFVHIADKKNLFEEVGKVLKKGGEFILITDCPEKSLEKYIGFFVVSQDGSHDRIYFDDLNEYPKLAQDRIEYLKKQGVKNIEVSLPYFPVTPADVESFAGEAGFEKIEGKVPNVWQPDLDEKNWGSFTRNAFLFKKN